MDEISQGPEREPRLSPKRRRGLATAAIAVLVAVAATFTLTRGAGHQGAAAPRASAATATPGSQRIALPGPQVVGLPGSRNVSMVGSQNVWIAGSQEVTLSSQPLVEGLVTTLNCQSATRGQLGPDWRAGSLHVGPLWLVAGRQRGYVHLGRWALPGGAAPGRGTSVRTVQMSVYVDPGSVVVMQIAPGTGPYFQFLDGAGQPLGGGTVVFESCPDSSGPAELYRLGFSIAAGHTASVEVWTVPSAGPAWLTFTAQQERA
jgi:hypothetical protein